MPARRCSLACESWPNNPLFNTCPTCGEGTSLFFGAEPSITLEEAKRARLYALFEEYYARRCGDLGIPSEGPLPAEFLVGS